MLSVLRNTTRLRTIAVYGVSLTAMFLSVAPVTAAQGNSSISQGFQTSDKNVSSAAVVSMEKKGSNSIELSNPGNKERLVGVVGDKPLIELSGSNTSSVQVVTSGLTLALVSDINGSVSNGDRITASPIEGIGMKLTESSMIVGIAQGDLKKVSTDTRSITDKDGKKQTVHIGLVPVQVGVTYYPIPNSGSAAYIPGFLQDIANNVSGRNVSPMRVLVAAIIMLLLFTSVSVLLYSAIKSSIISIGRNPLSESAVRKSLMEVGLTVVAVLLFSSLAIYLVLTV